jgi:aryl-alcohol dehydrogenase-like predicted oxidoreductase
MLEIAPFNKKIILGTALWGWGVARKEAYAMLENFIEEKGSIVDTATNYPINKCSKDMGLAIKWLADWGSVYSRRKLKLIVKIGSINNFGDSRIDLSSFNLLQTVEKLQECFRESLAGISIHWDNRNSLKEIKQTVSTMLRLRDSGLEIGFSGVSNPEIYYESSPELSSDWLIQVKENFLTSESRLGYERYFPSARYIAYGINMGGIKEGNYSIDSSVTLRGIRVDPSFIKASKLFLDSNQDLSVKPISISQLSLAYAFKNQSLSGVIIGPRKSEQLIDSMSFWKNLLKETNISLKVIRNV